MARPCFKSERRAQSVDWDPPARAGGLSGRRRSAISYQSRPRSASWESLWGSPSPAGACKSFPAGSTVASASAYGRIYGPRALPAPRFARAPRPSIEAGSGHWTKKSVRVQGAVDGSSDRSRQVFGPSTARRAVFHLCRVCQLVCAAKQHVTRRDPLHSALQELA